MEKETADAVSFYLRQSSLENAKRSILLFCICERLKCAACARAIDANDTAGMIYHPAVAGMIGSIGEG